MSVKLLIIINLFFGMAVKITAQAPCMDVSGDTVNTIYPPNSTSLNWDYLGFDSNYYLCGPGTMVYDTLYTLEHGCQVKNIYVNSGATLTARFRPYSHCQFPRTIWVKSGGKVTSNSFMDTVTIFAEPGAVINDLSGKATIIYTTCISFPAIDCISLGISVHQNKKITFDLFPTPAANRLLINVFSENIIPGIKVTVFDHAGQILEIFDLDLNHNSAGMDISRLPGGMYYLKMEAQRAVLPVGKFIICR